MTEFEFSLIPIAIIIGIAITRLLSSWASILRNWKTIHGSGFYLSISIFMLASVLGHFAGLWEYREISFSYFELIILISPTLFLMLSISVLVPAEPDSIENYAEHYFKYSRTVFILAAIAIGMSAVPDLQDGVLAAPTVWLIAAYLAPLIALTFTSLAKAHRIGHIVLWLVQTGYVFGIGIYSAP